MIELVPLFTAVYELEPAISVGVGPAGDRTVGAIRSATVTGERLRATLASPAAADWLVRTGTVGVIDVRLVLRTDDDALIYMTYGGRIDFARREAVMVAFVAPVFETASERYGWLNGVQAVGKGKLTIDANGGGRLDYEFFEIR